MGTPKKHLFNLNTVSISYLVSVTIFSFLQGALPIYSSRIAVSVIDNVLLVHQVDAKVVIIYDVFLDCLSPISAPLPLLLRGSSVSGRQALQVEDNLTSAYGAMIYGDSWTFLVPDLICDIDNGLLWRICLDLEVSLGYAFVPSAPRPPPQDFDLLFMFSRLLLQVALMFHQFWSSCNVGGQIQVR